MSVEATQPMQAVSCPAWCSPLYCDAVFDPVDVRHHSHPQEWSTEEGDVHFKVSRIRTDERTITDNRLLRRSHAAVLALENVEVLDMAGNPVKADVVLTAKDRDRLVAELLALDLPA